MPSRIAGWLYGLALLLVVASSCTPSPTAARESPPGRTPLRGGVLRLVQEAPASLDPLTANSVYESIVVNQIYDGLVALDPALNIVPALASTWTISRDGLTYTFQLRRNVRFHDGTPLTAEDVVFTLRRALAPESVNVSLASPYMAVIAGAAEYSAGRTSELRGVEAPDPHTVRIRLDRAYLSFLAALAMDGLRVVPRHVVSSIGADEFARQPVGSGPFRIERWDAHGLRLVAYPEYFGGAAHLDAVEIGFHLAAEDDGGVARFRRGELDAVEVPAGDLTALAQDPGVVVRQYHELSVRFLGLSTTTPPLDDVRVRQAIAHAVNRAALVADAPGQRRQAAGILPPGLPGYSPAPKALDYDPARARQLLREADASGRGFRPIELLSVKTTPAGRRIVEHIRADLAAVGLKLQTREMSWTELERALRRHTAPAFLLGWIADLADPDSFLRSLFGADAAANYFGLKDATAAQLLAAGARELSPVERARIYGQAEQRILSLAPLVPLYHGVGALAVRDGVHGLDPGPLGLCGVELERVWIDSPDRQP